MPKGTVFTIKETATNTLSLNCISGTCGTLSLTGFFSIATNGEALYIYQDTDDNPSNGVTQVHGVLGSMVATNSIFTRNSGINGNINDGSPSGGGTGTLDYCSVFNGDVSSEITQTNTITRDPLFTDAANNDYTLQNNSPLIDAGDNAAASES